MTSSDDFIAPELFLARAWAFWGADTQDFHHPRASDSDAARRIALIAEAAAAIQEGRLIRNPFPASATEAWARYGDALREAFTAEGDTLTAVTHGRGEGLLMWGVTSDAGEESDQHGQRLRRWTHWKDLSEIALFPVEVRWRDRSPARSVTLLRTVTAVHAISMNTWARVCDLEPDHGLPHGVAPAVGLTLIRGTDASEIPPAATLDTFDPKTMPIIKVNDIRPGMRLWLHATNRWELTSEVLEVMQGTRVYEVGEGDDPDARYFGWTFRSAIAVEGDQAEVYGPEVDFERSDPRRIWAALPWDPFERFDTDETPREDEKNRVVRMIRIVSREYRSGE
jgi:hypothetical protein